MRCLSCEYDLRHLTEHRCPECGCWFDPADPSTFEPDDDRLFIPSYAMLALGAAGTATFIWLWGFDIVTIILSSLLAALVCCRWILTAHR